MNLAHDSEYFLELQTKTGWGQMLASFARWCAPASGKSTLDVGCGPGLLSAIFSQAGALAFGVDHDPAMLQSALHPQVTAGKADQLPFAEHSFSLVSASNLLYLHPTPLQVLAEMARTLQPGGWLCLLNPSEHMSLTAAKKLADQRNLDGLARETLLNYGQRAEDHFRWSEQDLQEILADFGLSDFQTTLRMGPGLVRYARARKP